MVNKSYSKSIEISRVFGHFVSKTVQKFQFFAFISCSSISKISCLAHLKSNRRALTKVDARVSRYLARQATNKIDPADVEKAWVNCLTTRRRNLPLKTYSKIEWTRRVSRTTTPNKNSSGACCPRIFPLVLCCASKGNRSVFAIRP